MRMNFQASNGAKIALASAAAASLMIAPAIIYADASAPGIDRPKVMKKKPRAKIKRPMRAQAKPQMQMPAPEPVQEVVAAPEPAPMPAPEPAPVPEPVAVAPQPAPAAPPVVAKSGGKGWLLGLAAGAAVIAGIVIAADGDNAPASPS